MEGTAVPQEERTNLKLSLKLRSCHGAAFPHKVILILCTSKADQSAKPQSTRLTFLSPATLSCAVGHEKCHFPVTLPDSHFPFFHILPDRR